MDRKAFPRLFQGATKARAKTKLKYPCGELVLLSLELSFELSLEFINRIVHQDDPMLMLPQERIILRDPRPFRVLLIQLCLRVRL